MPCSSVNYWTASSYEARSRQPQHLEHICKEAAAFAHRLGLEGQGARTPDAAVSVESALLAAAALLIKLYWGTRACRGRDTVEEFVSAASAPRVSGCIRA